MSSAAKSSASCSASSPLGPMQPVRWLSMYPIRSKLATSTFSLHRAVDRREALLHERTILRALGQEVHPVRDRADGRRQLVRRARHEVVARGRSPTTRRPSSRSPRRARGQSRFSTTNSRLGAVSSAPRPAGAVDAHERAPACRARARGRRSSLRRPRSTARRAGAGLPAALQSPFDSSNTHVRSSPPVWSRASRSSGDSRASRAAWRRARASRAEARRRSPRSR